MKVQLLGAQGTRILWTTDHTDHRVRDKKAIQLSGPQPAPSNNPLFSGWAPKPYLYIELTSFCPAPYINNFLDSEVSLIIDMFFAESCRANVFVFFYVLVDCVVIRLWLFS